MPDTSRESSDLAIVRDLMREAVGVMEEFPSDFFPPDLKVPESESDRASQWIGTAGMDKILSNPLVVTWLQEVTDSWPKNFIPVFVQSSSILAQILEMFGAGHDRGMMDVLAAGIADAETMQLMMTLAQISKETGALKKDEEGTEEIDPGGMKLALLDELRRRAVARRAPVARTLTTLLGQDALLWLTAESRDGIGKIQPHEFSRTGWCKIGAIENQLAIESELLKLEPAAEYLGKIVVALSWTLAGLASFIPPAVFFGESMPHLSSVREGHYTVSVGTGTHTLVAFEPGAMLALVRILAEGLTNPLLSAADLMWIGAGLAGVREVRAGLGEPIANKEARFSLFLSHRGRDAKSPLSKCVLSLQASHGVFLDCLTLPQGVVNRCFVFGSMARSERISIVETENFKDSAWCRKEAWFADALAAHGLAKTERLTLAQAVARVAVVGSASTRRRAELGLGYPIAPRVLRDIDYWGRVPNLYSLKEAGHQISSLTPLQSVLEGTECPDDPAWVKSVGAAVAETLSGVVAAAPDAEPFDLWATALQYSLAAFGSTSNARSKMEVRRGVDQLNAILKSFVAARMHHDRVFRGQGPNYLALIAAAAAIDLAGFQLDPRMTPAMRIATGNVAGLCDGMLLLDVRRPGPERTFHLQLIALLVRSNLGSIGIVQNAADEVHQGHVGDLPLEVLPCVTLHPGMNSPFDLVPSH